MSDTATIALSQPASQQLTSIITTGIHKHFRMLQLRHFLIKNNYITDPKIPHTRIPGLWRKLHTLYDLEALDQREDARQLDSPPEQLDGDDRDSHSHRNEDEADGDEEEADDDDDVYSLAANKISNTDYEHLLDGFLDDEATDWAQRKWERRLLSKKERKAESPIEERELAELNFLEVAPVAFEARSLEVGEGSAGEEAEEVKGRRGRGALKGRRGGEREVGKGKGKATPAAAGKGRGGAGVTRRSARQAGSASVADTETPEQESESGEASNGEDESRGDDEEGSASVEQEESEANSTPAPRASRSGRGGRGGAVARGGAAGTRGKKRGRGRR